MSIIKYSRWTVIALIVGFCFSQAMEERVPGKQKHEESVEEVSVKKQRVQKLEDIVVTPVREGQVEGEPVTFNYLTARLSPTLREEIDAQGEDWNRNLSLNINENSLKLVKKILEVLREEAPILYGTNDDVVARELLLNETQQPNDMVMLRWYNVLNKFFGHGKSSRVLLSQVASFFDLPILSRMLKIKVQEAIYEKPFLIHVLEQKQKNIWEKHILKELRNNDLFNDIKKLVIQTVRYTQLSPESSVKSVAWSADGTRLAVGLVNGTVQIWQVTNEGYTQHGSFSAHSASVDSISWSAGGMLATGSSDNTVRIWQATTNGYALIETVTGYALPVIAMAWSPDGEKLAIGGQRGDEGNILKILRFTTNHDYEIDLNFQVTALIKSISWSPDNSKLVVGTLRGVDIWQVDQNRYNHIKQIMEGGVVSVAWSVDNKLAISVPHNGMIRIYYAPTSPEGGKVVTLRLHTITTPVVWMTGNQLAIGRNKLLDIYHVMADGGYEQVAQMLGDSGLTTLLLSVDNKLAAIAQKSDVTYINIWNFGGPVAAVNYLEENTSLAQITLLQKIAAAKRNGMRYRLSATEQKIYDTLGGDSQIVKQALYNALGLFVTMYKKPQ